MISLALRSAAWALKTERGRPNVIAKTGLSLWDRIELDQNWLRKCSEISSSISRSEAYYTLQNWRQVLPIFLYRSETVMWALVERNRPIKEVSRWDSDGFPLSGSESSLKIADWRKMSYLDSKRRVFHWLSISILFCETNCSGVVPNSKTLASICLDETLTLSLFKYHHHETSTLDPCWLRSMFQKSHFLPEP